MLAHEVSYFLIVSVHPLKTEKNHELIITGFWLSFDLAFDWLDWQSSNYCTKFTKNIFLDDDIFKLAKFHDQTYDSKDTFKKHKVAMDPRFKQ